MHETKEPMGRSYKKKTNQSSLQKKAYTRRVSASSVSWDIQSET